MIQRRGRKSAITNGLFLWSRLVGTAFISILTTRFLLEALGIASFGVFSVTVAIPLALSFLTGAMQVNSQRALAMNRGSLSERTKVFNAILGLHLCIAFMLFLVAENGGQWILVHVLEVPDALESSASQLLRITIVLIALGAALAPFEAALQVGERFGILSLLELLRSILLLMTSIWLTHYEGDRLIAYGWGFSLTNGTLTLVGALVARWLYPELRIRFRLLFNKSIFRTQLKLFFWALWGSASVVARSQGLAIVINIFFGPIGSAAYALGTQFQNVVRQMAGAISTVMAPRMFRMEVLGEREMLVETVLQSCRFSSLVALTISVPLIFEAQTIMDVWLVDPPYLAAPVTICLIVILLVDQLSVPFGIAHLAVGKVALYQTICGLVSIAFVPAAYIAGVSGANIVLVFTLLAGLAVVLSSLRVILFLPHSAGIVTTWLVDTVLRILFTVAPSFLVALVVTTVFPSGFSRLLLTCLLSIIVMVISASLLGIKAAERKGLCEYFESCYTRHFSK